MLRLAAVNAMGGVLVVFLGEDSRPFVAFIVRASGTPILLIFEMMSQCL